MGVSRAHLYRMRRASSQFRQMWDAALLLARPQVEEVLADRALNGVQEVVYYHGEAVATRTRFDSRLLLAHLARLDRLATTFAVASAANEFDERLEWLRRGPIVDDLDDDDYDYEDDDEGEGEGEQDPEAAEDAAEAEPEPAPPVTPEPDPAPPAASAADRAAGLRAGVPPSLAGFWLQDSVSCVSNSQPGGAAGTLEHSDGGEGDEAAGDHP